MATTVYDSYLIEHASKVVWQSPYEDSQFIIKMARLTDRDGELNEVNIFDTTISLPSQAEYYHVFMLGGNWPEDFGLPTTLETWISLVDYCNNNDFIVKIYTIHGQLVPLRLVYYYLEEDGNILFAIKDDDEVGILYGSTDIYFHFRSTKYFTTNHELSREDRIFVSSIKHVKSSSTQPLLNERNSRYLRGHNIMTYVNGYPQNVVSSPSISDTTELIDDGSIVHTNYFKVSDLKTFQSTLDDKNKYLIMLKDVDNTLNWHVFYRDDVEIYLMKFNKDRVEEAISQNTDKSLDEILDNLHVVAGNYYHRNREDSVRMVTYQSYSVPVDYIHDFINHYDSSMDLDSWYIKVTCHDSGLDRTHIAERNYTSGLHSLPYEVRLAMMTDTQATMEFWTATHLEESQYNYLMRCYYHELTPVRILAAYGYTQTTLAIANPNVSVTEEDSHRYFVVPVGLIQGATVYEYDRKGILLGWYHHTGGNKYLAVNEDCIFTEMYAGYGTHTPRQYQLINPTSVTVDEDSTLRSLYRTRVFKYDLDETGAITGDPTEVTLDSQYHIRDANNIDKFTIDSSSYKLITYPDKYFLSKDFTLSASSGCYQFTITHGELQESVLVSPAKLSVWVNGHALIENIDYMVDFPRVTIISKKWLNVTDTSSTINVTIRCLGFTTTGAVYPTRETGFVVNSRLSCDRTYNLHQNKVSRIIVGGGLYNPKLFTFDSEYGEAEVKGVAEGTPYMIDDHFVPLLGIANNVNIYQYYDEEREMSPLVDTYMTANYPYKDRPITESGNIHIKNEYQVYSPFIAAIVALILRNEDNYINFDYRDTNKLNNLVSRYKYLLEMDPAYKGYDEDFITCHPLPWDNTNTTPQVVHHRIFNLFENIAKQFLNYSVDFNTWFKVVRTRTES